MADGRLPEGLRDRVERTMAPLRPLAPPWRRAAMLLPWAAILLLAVPVVWGLRGDRDIVGPWRLWGISMLQIVLALVVAGAAVVESIPGRLPSRWTVLSIAGLGLAVFLATTMATFAASATFVPASFGARYFWICVSRPFLLGLPALAIVGVLVWRGLASRPVLTGALAGLGAGLLSDASWRLYCHVSDPGHVLLAHAGAIAALAAVGTAAGAIVPTIIGGGRR
jgi:hypothetical protein